MGRSVGVVSGDKVGGIDSTDDDVPGDVYVCF